MPVIRPACLPLPARLRLWTFSITLSEATSIWLRSGAIISEMRLITLVLTLLCWSIPLVSFADSPAWLNQMGVVFPAEVNALNFPDYQFVDSTHTTVLGEWTVGLNGLHRPTASLTSPCSRAFNGSHETCEMTIDDLVCRNSATITPCKMLLEYANWVDEYDCSLSISTENVSMRYCPEVQFVAGGKTIGPRSFSAVPVLSRPVVRWVTVHNNTTDPIADISVEFSCCGSSSEMWAVLLSADAGDTPIGPGQARALLLPRSLIGNVSTKDPSVVDRDQIDLTGQCVAQGVAVHLKSAKFGPWSETLGAIDLCKVAINVKPF